MRKLTTRWVLTAAALTVVIGAAGRAKADVELKLNPQAGVDLNSLTVGQTFSVTLDVVGISPDDPITFLNLHISTNTKIKSGGFFSVNEIDPGGAIPTPLDPIDFTGGADGGGGFVVRYDSAGNPDKYIGSDGTLATISLTALVAGSGSLVTDIGTGYGTVSVPYDASKKMVALSLQPFSIAEASAAPEPSTLASAGIAVLTLAGYGWHRRRKNRARAAA